MPKFALNMETLYKVSRIHNLMKDKPKAQRLHRFFGGEFDAITIEQAMDVLEIIERHTKEIKSLILSNINNEI